MINLILSTKDFGLGISLADELLLSDFWKLLLRALPLFTIGVQYLQVLLINLYRFHVVICSCAASLLT